MKVQCDVCERAEATVLCCADEAALCSRCDDRVHAANKLAGRHQRVPLLGRSSSHNPHCDICQEKAGYFFCLEDRAVLCRQCDVAIHTASPYVSSHQRYLVTGVRVALQQQQQQSHHLTGSSTTNNNSASSIASVSPGASNSSPERRYQPADAAAAAAPTGLTAEEMEAFRGRWPWDELFAGTDLEHCWYGLGSEPGSSRANSR